jgi:phenylacetate-CoA ligase
MIHNQSITISRIRKWLYFSMVGLRGQTLGFFYERFLREYQHGIPSDTSEKLLIQLFEHCRLSVPYYAEIMGNLGDSFFIDPIKYLQQMPILTKDVIRSCFNDLKSSDLDHRKWYVNTSGGSTGVPVRFIQDMEYAARSGAIKLLYSNLLGRELGESELLIWGSERDIIRGSDKWQTRLIRKLTNSYFVNAFRMTPNTMQEAISLLNARPPRLIFAYVDSIYELARFIEQEGLKVKRQNAIMTSAGVLYPFMREKIEKVFQCRVYNKYGSREVGDIACEHPGIKGLWIAPWGNYIEIVDSEGNRVPDGIEGDILVTSLTNYAMPFIRYRIGDRGVLASASENNRHKNEQILDEIIGRTTDNILTCHGDIVHGGYFMVLLFFKRWIKKYQVIQKSLSHLVFRIVRTDSDYQQSELDEIAEHAKVVMGNECKIEFEFVEEIPPSASGKYRYIISEIST